MLKLLQKIKSCDQKKEVLTFENKCQHRQFSLVNSEFGSHQLR